MLDPFIVDRASEEVRNRDLCIILPSHLEFNRDVKLMEVSKILCRETYSGDAMWLSDFVLSFRRTRNPIPSFQQLEYFVCNQDVVGRTVARTPGGGTHIFFRTGTCR